METQTPERLAQTRTHRSACASAPVGAPEISDYLMKVRFELRKPPDVAMINEALSQVFAGEEEAISETVNHLIQGGKRIRPMLLMHSGLIFDGPFPELLKAATAAELIHMASIIHDDVIDESGLRRNQPSVNKQRGNHLAVLTGNYLFAKAVNILAQNRLIASLDLMADAIRNMVVGELRQAGERFNINTSCADYFDRIFKKTAYLIKNCCESGALVAGAPPFQVKLLGEYGYHLGMAFQIVDDILDFNGDPAQMGKPKWEDISQGHMTLPLLFLFEDPSYGAWSKKIIMTRDFHEGTLAEITMVLNQTGMIAKCYRIAGVHLEKAKESLTRLPQSPYLDYFYLLANKLESRIR